MVLFVSACNETIDRRIVLADSLSLPRPDSAMMIMDSIEPMKGDFSRRELMRYELIRTKIQNRAYVDFTTDSVMKIVADYYDKHGSANDRMLAHYLLGCTYRDMKEAPMALQCYYDAVESADTLNEDCDYSTMMSIWGQIATTLDKQYLPMKELDAWKQYRKFALLSNDTLNYIVGLEMCVGAYNILADTANILRITDKAVELYKRHGYYKQAAIANASAIFVYLEKHNYSKVRALQQIYENESGLFDSNGNIAKGKEHYYCGKGLLYLGLNKLDSAEIYYRKLQNSSFRFDAYKGLLKLYQQYQNIDSVLLYSTLLSDAYNEKINYQQSQAMYQVKGMYDYSRNQKVALQKENEALRNKISFILVSCLLVVVCGISLYYFNYSKKRKKEEITQLTNKYISSVIQLNKVSEEQVLMKDNFLRFQDEKEAEAKALKNQVAELEGNFARINMQEKVSALLNCDLVNHFRRFGQTGSPNEMPSNKDWKDLETAIGNYVPSLSVLINRSNILPIDKQVIILTYLGFSAKEISVILDKSASRISNIKAITNEKLFNNRDARTLFSNLRDYL